MNYNDFASWCNERACDGRWGFSDALRFMEVAKQINSVKCRWWRKRKAREEMWNKLNVQLCLEERVNQINEKIKGA